MKLNAIRAALLCTLCSSSLAADKPNILLIYSDDHGWADLGAQGADKDIRTPNLDQLTREGVLFKRGYVTAPQCAPSRGGVLTGRYQQRFGLEDNRRGLLPLSELTIAERLKPAGYVSGMAGKWGLDISKGQGNAPLLHKELMPHAQGFDEYWRGERTQYYASHDLKGRPFADAPHLVKDDRFRVEVQTEAALGFLDRRARQPKQPWFFYLAWFAPHVPLESPEPWFSQTPANLPLPRRQALAMIAAMDEGLGRIRSKLREMGAEKDTLIFFISDNGAPLGEGWDGSVNLPMRGQKGMLSEGGIRTPFVAAWPGKWPAGTIYDQPVISLDVAATAVALAGLPHDNLDGVNLMPFLTGQNKAAPHEAIYWRWLSQAAIQEHPWKLIQLGEHERMLFDITTPEGEDLSRNLIKEKPEVAARLQTRLASWAATLQPPGFNDELAAHHKASFAEYGMITKLETQPVAVDNTGTPQSWLGTVAKVDAGARQVVVMAGRELTFTITDSTKIRQQGKPLKISDIKDGASVTVESVSDGGRLTARSIILRKDK
ncbi:sulfatase-like hydrolase/transferase [Prosthecobacter sp.]|uniref:sulfatase-like hydrolase/transferase n=1 Tax=Prosthecobacter sp. TaxID=1965333 RepID=UPI003783CBC4